MIPTLGVWPPLPPAALLRSPRESLPFPLAEAYCRVFAKGRHALHAGVVALDLAEGDEVLMPAYSHGAEVEALLRAGLSLRWYEATPTLEPDEDELEALLGDRTRALHLTHYLGFPQDAPRWRRWCDERGLLLLEDAAQSWLAEVEDGPLGSFGHVSIACLYKSVGVPDGAALLVDAETVALRTDARLGAEAAGRKAAAWLAGRSSLVASALARVPREPGRDDMTLGTAGPASRATCLLVPRLAGPGVAAARRANYEALLEELNDEVVEPFGVLPPGASPFCFPVDTDDKTALLERLARGGVTGLDLWSGHHPAFPAEDFPVTRRRRERTVGLPVHQELGPAGVEQVLRAFRGPKRRRAEGRLDRPATPEEIWDEWAALAERTENVFATPDWASIWWNHFGTGKELLLGSLRAPSGELEAVLPLYVWKEWPVRVARIVGHDAGDQLGPVTEPEHRPAAARALRRLLDESGCAALIGEQTAASEGWRHLFGAQLLTEEGSPVLRLEGLDWDGYLASRSKNFRDQVRGRERKLAKAHRLSYRLSEDSDRLQDDLSILFELHRARWHGEPTTFGTREAFHRDFAARALERGWLRFWILELDGVPAAAWYGFRFGRAECYYQAGRRPELERESVGFVLMAHTIREAIVTGAEEYRLLRGGEEYKYRFAASDRGLETIGLSTGASGAAALASARALRSSRNAARLLSEQARKQFAKGMNMN